MDDASDIRLPFPNWRLVRKLGKGGYGTVWEAECPDLGGPRRAAIKIMHAYSQSEAEELQNEYLMMKRLADASHVVKPEEVKTVPSAAGYDVFIRMELLIPLEKWLEAWEQQTGEGATEQVIIKIARDIGSALWACEQSDPPIIHRDIKPANIMVSVMDKDSLSEDSLDDNCCFKLGDFGIARLLVHTHEYTQIGTPNYCAPEIESGNGGDCRSDIYSLGKVMQWLLCKSPTRPFSEATEELGGELTLSSIIDKACSFFPEDRYQSAEELNRDLDNLRFGTRGQRRPARRDADPNATPTAPTKLRPIPHDRGEDGQSGKKQDRKDADKGPGTHSISRRALLGLAAASAIGLLLASQSYRSCTASEPDSKPQRDDTSTTTDNDSDAATAEDDTSETTSDEAASEDTASAPDRSVEGWTIVNYDGYKTNPVVSVLGSVARDENDAWVAMRRKDGSTYVFSPTGYPSDSAKEVETWTGIRKIVSQGSVAVGLRDGTTPVTTYDALQSAFTKDASTWTDLADVTFSDSYSGYKVYGARQDGSVFRYSTGSREYTEMPDLEYGSQQEEGYQNVAAFAEPYSYLVLHKDGTCSCPYLYAEDNVATWTDVIQVADNASLVLGVRSDGTMLASVGSNPMQVNYDAASIIWGWTGIRKVALDFSYCVGLKQDGTLVMATSKAKGVDTLGISDVVDIAVVFNCIVAIQSDGTIQYADAKDWE